MEEKSLEEMYFEKKKFSEIAPAKECETCFFIKQWDKLATENDRLHKLLKISQKQLEATRELAGI